MNRETDFESLVDTFYPSLYRFAFSLTQVESDARDLTQETFYIWAVKGHQLKDRTKVKSWLFTTLYREHLGRRRKLTRFPELDLSQAEDELPEIPAISLDRLDGPLVLEALSRLDEAFQGPVALFYLEDYTYPEIAEILEIPLGTVKSRISRGLAQLQRMIAVPKPSLSGKGAPVNREEARRILIAYRAGIDDRTDPETREALRLAENDPELREWLEHQRDLRNAIRAHLRKISVPSDLQRQILAGRKVLTPPWRRREVLAVAATAAVLLSLSAFWFGSPAEEETFAAFRSRMVRFAVREYRMDIVTNDATRVRQYLAEQKAPADYTVTGGLNGRPVVGGAKLSWHGHAVAMICFSASTKETLYLFVLDRAAVRDGKVPRITPETFSMHRLNGAAWSRGDRVYLLAAPIEQAELQKLL